MSMMNNINPHVYCVFFQEADVEAAKASVHLVGGVCVISGFLENCIGWVRVVRGMEQHSDGQL